MIFLKKTRIRQNFYTSIKLLCHIGGNPCPGIAKSRVGARHKATTDKGNTLGRHLLIATFRATLDCNCGLFSITLMTLKKQQNFSAGPGNVMYAR